MPSKTLEPSAALALSCRFGVWLDVGMASYIKSPVRAPAPLQRIVYASPEDSPRLSLRDAIPRRRRWRGGHRLLPESLWRPGRPSDARARRESHARRDQDRRLD